MKVEAGALESGDAGRGEARKSHRAKERAAKKAARSLHVPLDFKISEASPEKPRKSRKSRGPEAAKRRGKPRQETHEPASRPQSAGHEIYLHPPVEERHPAPELARQSAQEFLSPVFSIRDYEPPAPTRAQPESAAFVNEHPAAESQLVATQQPRSPDSVAAQPTIEQLRRQLLSREDEFSQLITEPTPLPDTNIEEPVGPTALKPGPSATEQIAPAPPHEEVSVDLPPGQHLEQSAWLSYAVDNKTGHAVENSPIDYGEAFYSERHPESHPAAEPDDVAIASGQLAVDESTDVGLQPQADGSYNDDKKAAKLKSKDSKLLGKIDNTLHESRPLTLTGLNTGNFGLWVALILVVIAIILAIIL